MKRGVVHCGRCDGLSIRHYTGGANRARKCPVCVSLLPFDAARNSPKYTSTQVYGVIKLTCSMAFANAGRSVPSAHSQNKCALQYHTWFPTKHGIFTRSKRRRGEHCKKSVPYDTGVLSKYSDRHDPGFVKTYSKVLDLTRCWWECDLTIVYRWICTRPRTGATAQIDKFFAAKPRNRQDVCFPRHSI